MTGSPDYKEFEFLRMASAAGIPELEEATTDGRCLRRRNVQVNG